ncbi:MAG: alpha/beta hydrolase [Proteobacteria bacterium]|nr:alpha/beta hydrolase [Pseudomonadota bacterium]MCP4917571.1 alpha/beta hydrolase [Pseudomonadota bacterium]
MILLLGCATMDGFFFDPTPLDAYELGGDVIPPELVELVEFESTDGTLLYGAWARQPEPELDEDPAPTLMHHHGNKGNLDFHWERVELYWSYGYDVFIYDYRGYGLSQGTPTHDNAIGDGIAATELVLETAELESRELFVHGTSLGGYVSVNSAGAFPPAALVTEDLFSSAENLAETNTGLALRGGYLFEGEWDAMAAAGRLDDVPLLVVHGDADTYIRPEHARWLYDAAVDPKALWLVPGGNHGPAADSPRHYEILPDEYRDRISEWLSSP